MTLKGTVDRGDYKRRLQKALCLERGIKTGHGNIPAQRCFESRSKQANKIHMKLDMGGGGGLIVLKMITIGQC